MDAYCKFSYCPKMRSTHEYMNQTLKDKICSKILPLAGASIFYSSSLDSTSSLSSSFDMVAVAGSPTVPGPVLGPASAVTSRCESDSVIAAALMTFRSFFFRPTGGTTAGKCAFLTLRISIISDDTREGKATHSHSETYLGGSCLQSP
jgi:hypothetical protein